MSATSSARGRSERSSGDRANGHGRARGRPITVLIVDDERTFGEALELALERERDVRVVEVATDADEALRAAEEHRPDVILMDVVIPGMSGLEATRRIKETAPESQVLIVSGIEDEYLLARAVQAGASGLVRKTDAISQLLASVRRAHRGEPLMDEDEVEHALRRLRHRRRAEEEARNRVARLTPRERQILQLMAEGMSPPRIAQELHMSPGTLRTHVQNFITKLGVHSKMEALVLAIRHGAVTTVDLTERGEGGNGDGDGDGSTRPSSPRIEPAS